MTEEGPSRPAPGDVQGLIERIEEGWRELLAACDGIPDERGNEAGVVGDWSLANLYGHIGFWDERALFDAEGALAGRHAANENWQQLNDADHAARQGRTLPEERSAMHQAHAALVEYLEGVSHLDAGALDEAIKESSYEHYAEHVPDVTGWRARTGV